MLSNPPEIKVFENLDELSLAAAAIFAELAQDAGHQRGKFFTALSGGSTPLPLYRLLSQPPYANSLNWNAWHVFWGDERCVPPNDPESCYGEAMEALFSKVTVPAGNIWRIEGELGPKAASAVYDRRLAEFGEKGRAWPRFDLVLLGLGADGHTASLFPGSHPAGMWDSATMAATASYQGRPALRVSLTPPVFNSARTIIFLVNGEDKARALAATLQGQRDPFNLPAQNIIPDEGKVTWLVDKKAASLLR